MPMSMTKRLLPLSCSLLLSAMVAGGTNAQGLPFIEYAAKFTCGPVSPDAAGGGDADVVIGVYATSINIHNPQATPVKFRKKIAVSNPEGREFGKVIIVNDEMLDPDQAERVDCPLIFKVLQPAERHIEGFVVLEIPAGDRQPLLDVVGKYSARPSNGEVSTLDVVIYSPKEIKF
jgi:hypothetical protein